LRDLSASSSEVEYVYTRDRPDPRRSRRAADGRHALTRRER